MRLKGMAAVFNDAARIRLCESSGSEHYSPDTSDDLSDLVNSFIERDSFTNTMPQVDDNHDPENDSKLEDSPSDNSENNNKLQDLLSKAHEDEVRRKIRVETQLACEVIGDDNPSRGFKRRLMSHLRHRGFDAGVCKSQWGKLGKQQPGEYEYVDVNVDGNRFIIEVNLGAEFEIARPTAAYTTLLNLFPRVFVGKQEEVKQIVRLMGGAVRLSMKQMGLHVPPWRRNGYMLAKWFGPYKRTVNEVPTKNKPMMCDQGLGARRSIGFEAFSVKGYKCRGDNFIGKVGLKVGYLTAALNANDMDPKL